jgi:hypothetical protein
MGYNMATRIKTARRLPFLHRPTSIAYAGSGIAQDATGMTNGPSAGRFWSFTDRPRLVEIRPISFRTQTIKFVHFPEPDYARSLIR